MIDVMTHKEHKRMGIENRISIVGWRNSNQASVSPKGKGVFLTQLS